MIDKIKQWSGVIALVAIVLLVAFLVPNKTGIKYGAILDTSQFDYFNASTAGGFQINGTTILSATSFSLPSGVTSWTINGLTDSPTRTTSLTAATTTVCAIQSPTAATSTLRTAGIRLTTSSTTASTLTFAQATTAFATTTAIGSQIAIAAGAQSSAIASTTSTTGGSTIFAPGAWFVVGMQGSGGNFSPVGSCFASWTQM